MFYWRKILDLPLVLLQACNSSSASLRSKKFENLAFCACDKSRAKPCKAFCGRTPLTPSLSIPDLLLRRYRLQGVAPSPLRVLCNLQAHIFLKKKILNSKPPRISAKGLQYTYSRINRDKKATEAWCCTLLPSADGSLEVQIRNQNGNVSSCS